jgi:hypothetical protein
LLRISSHNLLNFQQEISIKQHPEAESGRSYMKIKSKDTNMDELVLFKFNQNGGSSAFLQPFPCGPWDTGWCSLRRYGKEYHLKLAVPGPGSITYAGYWQYEIVDQFPHRGTQNQPLVKNMTINSNHQQDLKKAFIKWPLLKGKKITESLGSVVNGRVKEFNF